MKEITLEAKTENIPQLTAWIDGELERLECPVKAQMQIDMAIDEIFSNIARYGYGNDGGQATVQFDFDEKRRTVLLVFMDSGVPYNPLENEDPDVTLSARERGIGGLGIFLVKKLMDAVKYRYSDGHNILCIEKNI